MYQHKLHFSAPTNTTPYFVHSICTAKHRCTGREVRGGQLPPPPDPDSLPTSIRAESRDYSGKTQVRLTRIQGLLLQLMEKNPATTPWRPRKISATTPPPPNLVGCKQRAIAIRAKLGLTPQMDVGPYAYAAKYHVDLHYIYCQVLLSVGMISNVIFQPVVHK